MKKLFLTLTMLLFAFTSVMRASAEQGNVRADQVIEQGFEDGMGDWTMNNCHSSSGPTSSYGGNTGNYAFRFYYTTNYPQYLISPELDDNDGVNFTFYAARYSANYPETFKVGYSSTTNEPTEFTWGSEETCTTMYGAGAYQEYSYDFPAGTKYVSIACTSNDQFYLFVDDITVTAIEPAPAPGGIVEVTIGDPTSTITNAYVPGYSLYDYAISQQIYTADEIGVAGAITTLTMWLKNTSSYARNLNVYMKEIEATEFASNTAWESFAAADMVASFTMPNQNTDPIEVALPLNTPFNYSGNGSLAICFQDVTGSWSSGLAGVVMDANGNQAIYAYRDGTVYDPSNVGANGSLLIQKNVIKLTINTGGGGGESGEITVHDGTDTNGNVPVYGFYADAFLKCEMVYPAAELSEMSGSMINSMTFYASQASVDWGTNYQVFMTEVADATISAYAGPDAATVVYEGALSIVDGQMVVTFDTPYTYGGGNLLVGVYQTTQGTYIASTWYGENVTGASVQGYSFSSLDGVSAAQRNFLPKTTFVYEGSGTPTAPVLAAEPSTLNMGYPRPNGYWMASRSFELSNSKNTPILVNTVTVDNEFFTLDIEAPFEVVKGEPVTVNVSTGTGEIGDQYGHAIFYYGEDQVDTVFLEAYAYNAVSPDVWELAQEVPAMSAGSTYTTEFPVDMYKNYELPFETQYNDVVYQLTFNQDVLFSAGAEGGNMVLYTEDFNGEDGPMAHNNYQYNGPVVNPGPVDRWFNYDYTGSNTWYGTSAGGGFYFGYKIPATKIEELGIANSSLTTVEAAARESYPYDLYVFRGGDDPFSGEMVCYQPMGYNPEALYFFDVNLDNPVLVGTEDLWIVFYSDSPYAAYCGRYPVDVENGKLWTYIPTSSSLAWNYNTNYTPVIYCRFIDLPTGREVTMNLANMEVKKGNGVASEIAEAEGNVMNVAKAQRALNNRSNRGNRDMQTLFEQGFEDGMGEWTMNNCHGSSGPSSGYTAHGGSNAFRFYYTSNYPQYLISPVLEDNNGGNMSFYYAVYSSNYPETFKVGYSSTTNEPTEFTWGSEVTCTTLYSDGYEEYSYDFPAGTKYVSIACTSNDQFYLFIDDITVTADLSSGGGGSIYQIANLYVPAGTYYLVAAAADSTAVNIVVDTLPTPDQALVYSPFNGESNVQLPYLASWHLGYYTNEMQVLVGTDYPPTTSLIDWTDYLQESAFLPELLNNRMYFFQVNERNNSGTTEGEIIAFTTLIEPVQHFTAVNPNIYVGDVAEFTWDAIEDEEFLGYNFYFYNSEQGAYVKMNEELLTENTYAVEGLEYNMYGYSFCIEAVYEVGTSPWVLTTVYVSGYATVEGYVFEQDGETPISGAKVFFKGYDAYGNYTTYLAQTDEEGHYTQLMKTGEYYEIGAELTGYQTVYNEESLALEPDQEVEGYNFILDEVFYGVDYVKAYEKEPYPMVEWGNYVLYAEFEDGIPEGWTLIDADGDGYNWENGINGGHNSDNSVASASWKNGIGALTPDNYLVTPQVPLNGELSFWARANDTDFAAEHFGVAISTEGNQDASDFTTIQEWTMTAKRGNDGAERSGLNRGNRGGTGEWYKYTVDLSAYEGQLGYVAIRHFNCFDMYVLSIDDLIIDGEAGGDRSFQYYRVYRTAYDNNGPYNINNTTVIGEFTDVTSLYDETFGEVETGLYKYGVASVYEGNRDDALNEFTETFDEGLPEGWTMIDADWDGRCWMLGSEAALGFGHGHEGSNDMMISKSFENGSSLCPDNYLVTPQVNFGKMPRFEFWACAQDENYANEYFGVAVSTASNDYVYDFQTVAEFEMTAKGEPQGPRGSRGQGTWYQYSVDLEQFAGQIGYIAIRHFNTCNQFYLDIDDVHYYDIDVQGKRESAIRWSNAVGKDMYLTDGAVEISVELESGDTPEGVVATFHNETQPEYEDIVVELDENGYYSFDSFRKGGYTVKVEKAGYLAYISYEEIWEPTSLEYMISEILLPPANFTVTRSGYASWDAPQTNDRHFTGDYSIGLYDNYGNHIWELTLSEANNTYIPEYALSDGQLYTATIRAFYSTIYGDIFESENATCSFRYKSCDHFTGADNFTAKQTDDGVFMTWDYPVVDSVTNGTRDMWDLAGSMSCTSAYQYGVATDGTYIYTSSWSASSTSMFYKYDMDGNLVEEFNIEGCGQIRDMTYDGQYFYGAANSSTIYCVDFNNKELVSTIVTEYGTIRCITYDPERDGFWVVGNWSGALTLINRMGNIVFAGPEPTSASGIAYYKDNEGAEHVYYLNNSDNNVYDYDIANNTFSEFSVLDLNYSLPDVTGTSGGAFVGAYDGKVCLYTDIQQSPQLIGMFELAGEEPEVPGLPIGAELYVYDEYYGFTEGKEWMLEGYGIYDSYSIRVVYDNHDRSCMQYPEIINRYYIYTSYDGSGMVSGEGYYYDGDTCVLSATANDGYDFVCWEDSWYGGIVSKEPTYSFVVTRDGEYHARFVTDHYGNDVNLYENNMNVIGLIEIEGEEQEDEFLEIGAFCNGECRGHQRLHYYPQVERYLVYLTIYGNNDDQIDFRLYNHRYEYEMDLTCQSKIVFEADAVMGTPFEPYEFNFVYNYWVDQYNEFNTGWNWWSTYIEQNDYDGLADLQSWLNNGNMISSQTAYTMNYGEYGWYGSLTSINNESMYKIKMDDWGEFYKYHHYARPEFHPITLSKGWNYIGYLSMYSIDVNDALAGFEASSGDMIKSQYAYANYYEGYGWFGSLNTMEPGMGYMYKSVNDEEVTFNYASDFRGTTKENLTAENNHWMPNTNAYKDNMTIMAVVNLDDVELSSDNYELAAFVNGECRGSVRLTYAEPLNRYVAFLTVAGEEAAELSFGLYSAETNTECYNSDNSIAFGSDAVVGNPNEPAVIFFSSNGMDNGNSIKVYPNPVAQGELINIDLASKPVRIEILNALGEIMVVENKLQQPFGISAPTAPGIYTVRVITENEGIISHKIIVK